MRGLSSRGVRPCLHHSASARTSLGRGRRAIIPPTQLTLTSADAFIILLPGVLTAAFVLDITARQRRSDALQQQIDTLERESEELQRRQMCTWDRIQHRSIQRGIAQQRRMMSTVANQAWLTANSTEELDPSKFEAEFDSVQPHTQQLHDAACRDPQNIDTQIRYERLVATRLALSLMLELRAGRTGNVPVPYKVDANAPSMDYIVHQLERVIALIRSMHIERVPYGVQYPPDIVTKKQMLDSAIIDQIELYRQKQIHLPELITSYTQLIKDYKIGPSVRTYVRLMRAMSTFQKHSAYAKFTEEAIWHAHARLDDFALSNIFFRLGKDQESSRLIDLLHRLTKEDKWPHTVGKWFRAEVNGITISLPATSHPYTLPSLIRATLLNQQVSIAEAQAVVFMERLRTCPQKLDSVCKYYVVTAFLESCGFWGTWDTGKRWLETAVAWSEEFCNISDLVLGRVVLRMLDFCVACQRKEAYSTILDVALACNLRLPGISEVIPYKVTERMEHIRMDWANQAKLRRITSESSCDVASFRKHLSGFFDEAQKSLPMQKAFHPSEGSLENDPAVARYKVTLWRREQERIRNQAAAEQLQVKPPSMANTSAGFQSSSIPIPLVSVWGKAESTSYTNSDAVATSKPMVSLWDEPELAERAEPSSNLDMIDDSSEFVSPFFQPAQEIREIRDSHEGYDSQLSRPTTKKSEVNELERLRAALEQANQKVSLLERQLSVSQSHSHEDEQPDSNGYRAAQPG